MISDIAQYASLVFGFLFFVILLYLGERRSVNHTYLGPLPSSFHVEEVEVIDGDTVRALYKEAWVTVRLSGIDAPELRQRSLVRWGRSYPLGYEAQRALLNMLIEGGSITCSIVGRDRYGRSVGIIATAKCEDVGRALVSYGWAVAYRQYGGDRYVQEEELARNQKRGIWGHDFIEPERWRQLYGR